MPSSPDDALIEAALQYFSKQLHSTFPLRNFTEFYDEEQLKEKILQLKEDVSKNVLSKVWDRDKDEVFSLVKKIQMRMNKEVIAEWVAQNRRHHIESVTFLQRKAEMFCEDFQMALEDQLLLNPDMEMSSFKNYVDNQKVFAISYFDGIWKLRNSQIQMERKAKMKKLLDSIGDEVIEKHRNDLERKEVSGGKRDVEDVKTIIMEKSRQLKSYVDSHPRRLSKRFLKTELKDMKEYVSTGKGSTLRESEQEIYSKVVETLDVGIKFLTEDGNANSLDDFTHWAEGFNLMLKSYCSIDDGVENGAQRIQEEANGCDSSNRSKCITMQQVLNKDSLGLCDHEERDSGNRSPMEDGNDSLTGNNEDERVRDDAVRIVEESSSKTDDHRHGPATSANERVWLHRSSSLNLSATENDNSPTMGHVHGATCERPLSKKHKSCSHVSKHDSPPSKRIRTGGNGNMSRKTITKADRFVSWQTSGVNDKTNDSAQATPSRRSSRLKKKYHSSDGVITSVNVPNQLSASSLHSHSERVQSDKENESTIANDSLKGSPARHPDSNPRNTDKSGSDSDGSCQLGHPGSSLDLDKITILEGDAPCKKRIKKQNLKSHDKFCFMARRLNKCDHCDMRFRSKKLLEIHNPTHTGEKPYKCPTCNKRFTRKDNLSAHIRIHTGRFSCEKCKQSFNYRHNLKLHMLKHDGKLPFGCSYCDIRSETKANQLTHTLTHSDERPYNCVTCKRQFCTRSHLTRHFQRVHRLPKQDVEKQANDAAVEYLRKVTKNPNYQGAISNMVVLSHAVKKANLRIPDEMDKMSSTPATPSRSTGPDRSSCFERITMLGGDPPTYKCDACGSEIKRKCDLKHHGKNCNKNGYACLHCGKKFFKMSRFVIHQRIHTGEKPFKCTSCNKQFTDKSNLRAHLQTHTGKTRFTCKLCQRKFKHGTSLNWHMLRHEGKLPVGCSYCDLRFPMVKLLKEHVITHSGERPYKCPACKRAFNRRQVLVQHIQGQHHHTKEDAMKFANEAASTYLKTVTQNPNYDGDISQSTVLSHAIKKANLKISGGVAK